MTGGTLIPILAELIARGDGSYILRPIRPVDTEEWISVKDAANVLRVKPASLYPLLGKYLVYRRVLKAKVQVSLASLTDYQRSISDPDFWADRTLQRPLIDRVRQTMRTRVESSLQPR